MSGALSPFPNLIALLPGCALAALMWLPSVASAQDAETKATSSCAEALRASPTTPAAPGSEEAQREAHIAQQVEELIRLWRDTESAKGGSRTRTLSQQERAENQRKFRERLDEFSRRYPEAQGRLEERMTQELNSLGAQTSQRLTPAQREKLTSSLHELQDQLDQLQNDSKNFKNYEIKMDDRKDANFPTESYLEEYEDGSKKLEIGMLATIFVDPPWRSQYLSLKQLGSNQPIRVSLREPSSSWIRALTNYIATYKPTRGHAHIVKGARQVPNGSILSWSIDHTVILWTWNGKSYKPTHRLGEPFNGDPLLGHTGWVEGARQLQDGSILSWSWDHTLIIWTWNETKNEYEPTYTLGEPHSEDPTLGHTIRIDDAKQLSDGSILSRDFMGKRRLIWSLWHPPQLEAEIARLEEEVTALQHRIGEAVQ